MRQAQRNQTNPYRAITTFGKVWKYKDMYGNIKKSMEINESYRKSTWSLSFRVRILDLDA